MVFSTEIALHCIAWDYSVEGPEGCDGRCLGFWNGGMTHAHARVQ